MNVPPRPAPPPDAAPEHALFPPERIGALRQQRQQMREHRIERFKADQRIGLLMHGLAQDTDELLRTLWGA